MATKYNEVQSFEKSADSIMTMFSDKAYFEKKYAQLANSCEIREHRHEGNDFHIKAFLHYDFEAPVPGFAKKFIGDALTVTQEDTWDTDARKGQLNIHIAGAPVTIHADMELVETASGCENRLSWTIDCNVPLVGGKLEKMILQDITAKAPRDLEVSRSIAADY